MKGCWILFAALLGTGCMREAFDPMSMAPGNSYSSWTPMQGNTMVSSKYCKTVLPPAFQSEALNLAQLVDIALMNNPSTRQTWAQARSAAAQ